ncbi:MAG: restriction endonuclease, partial [archaeon]|nr:restriction endonuclease [archaeon]
EQTNYELSQNRFVGFKRLVFSDEFIDTAVRGLWEDIRDKVLNHKLVDVVKQDKHGKPVINPHGEVSSAPNFMKSSQNTVFLRGSGTDSSFKTEIVNGIKMLPQYVWIKGSAVVNLISEEINY